MPDDLEQIKCTSNAKGIDTSWGNPTAEVKPIPRENGLHHYLHGLDPIRALVLKHSIKHPCWKLKWHHLSTTAWSILVAGRTWGFQSSCGHLRTSPALGDFFLWFPLSVEHTKIECHPHPKKKVCYIHIHKVYQLTDSRTGISFIVLHQ